MVPSGWKHTRLGNVAELQRGFDLPSSKRIDGDIPIVSSGGFSGYHNVSKAKPPGIVTGRYGSIGNVYFIEEDFWPLNTSLWVKDFHGNEPLFIYYLLTSFDFKKFSDKTGVPGVNRNDLHAVKVFVPPNIEQIKVAKILSTWDKAISTTECLIDNSKRQKKALMQQLLTGKKRLLDDLNKPFKDEWEEVKLGDTVSTGRGFAFKSSQYSESGYKIVRVTNIDSSGKIDLTDCVFIPNETSNEYKKYELYDNDILLVMVGATAGKLGFVTQNTLPSLLNQNMWSLRTKDSGILCQLFLRHVIVQVVARYLLSQQGSARGFFTQKTFESVKFLIPSIQEQQKIASLLTNADKEIELLEQKLADFKQEKKALMQQLLTGKRRVKIN